MKDHNQKNTVLTLNPVSEIGYIEYFVDLACALFSMDDMKANKNQHYKYVCMCATNIL